MALNDCFSWYIECEMNASENPRLREIDHLIHRLYSLTPEEIELIEEEI